MAPTAVEWLADASPKLHTTTESVGQTMGAATWSAPDRDAIPTARGDASDGGRLRDDRQLGATEHLVATARDRLVDRRHHAVQHVAHGVDTRHLLRARVKPPDR
jgi:hypothetical protein